MNNPLITRLCTTGSPAPLVSPGNAVYVHFHSDGISSDRGFQIAYHPTPGKQNLIKNGLRGCRRSMRPGDDPMIFLNFQHPFQNLQNFGRNFCL